MKRIITGLLLFCIAGFASAQQSYLCVADKAIGFSYDTQSKSWVHTRFKVEGEKHLIKKTFSGWSWVKFGQELGLPCDEMNKHGYQSCLTWTGNVRFNSKHLRYLETKEGSYVGGTDNGESSDTYITIGTCTAL